MQIYVELIIFLIQGAEELEVILNYRKIIRIYYWVGMTLFSQKKE